jgi:uncharacterized membrane protein YdjX (TVP38/TMEM64 family)
LENKKLKEKNYTWVTLIILISVALIILFFYLDRQNQLSLFIRAWGMGGILLSILLVAALCMTPIPSEGLVLLLFKIFGVYMGTFYAWLGSIVSSLVIFYLVRYFGQSFFQKLITPRRSTIVDNWIKKKGSIGLLIARFLPIPAFVVNYIAGAMPSVKLWPFVWTAAISIIPYYIGTALVYVGIAKSTWIWLALGTFAILFFWGISYFLSKESNKA